MALNDAKINFWIKNELNVLIKGRRGTGKSSVVIDAFNRNNLKWKYFSAATMDPWVDFIGVPKEVKTSDGKSYLDLIRPKEFMEDDIEAIFLDEFNRAPKKVRNAVMELIQFKSINGRKFNKLKLVWAAINPDDDESEENYDVEKLDPAQIDRFHVIVESDDRPDKKFFSEKFGEKGLVAIDWWGGLPKEIKDKISPRRLEYMLNIFNLKGDVQDVLPKQINIQQLVVQLNSGSYISRMKKIYADKDENEARELLKDENAFAAIKNTLVSEETYLDFFHKFIPDEKLVGYLVSSPKFKDFILKDKDRILSHRDAFANVLRAKNITDKKLFRQLTQRVAPLIGTTGPAFSSASAAVLENYSQKDKMTQTFTRNNVIYNAFFIKFEEFNDNHRDDVLKLAIVVMVAGARTHTTTNIGRVNVILDRILLYLKTNKIDIPTFVSDLLADKMLKKWYYASNIPKMDGLINGALARVV